MLLREVDVTHADKCAVVAFILWIAISVMSSGIVDRLVYLSMFPSFLRIWIMEALEEQQVKMRAGSMLKKLNQPTMTKK
jgi:hypothetical protein